MEPSKIDKHIKEEPCAKQRALLGVLSSRCSSVSRGHRKKTTFWPDVIFPRGIS
jgi:hypothetical protein